MKTLGQSTEYESKEQFEILGRTYEALKEAEPDDKGFVRPSRPDCLDILVAPENIEQAIQIWRQLFHYLHGAGAHFKLGTNLNGQPFTDIVYGNASLGVYMRDRFNNRPLKRPSRAVQLRTLSLLTKDQLGRRRPEIKWKQSSAESSASIEAFASNVLQRLMEMDEILTRGFEGLRLLGHPRQAEDEKRVERERLDKKIVSQLDDYLVLWRRSQQIQSMADAVETEIERRKTLSNEEKAEVKTWVESVRTYLASTDPTQMIIEDILREK